MLSALPLVNFGNCCCCLWVICGGALAAYLRQQNSPTQIEAAEGALVGLMAGAVGGVVATVLSIPFQLLIGPYQRQIMERFLASNPDVPAEARDAIERFGGGAGAAMTIVGMMITIVHRRHVRHDRRAARRRAVQEEDAAAARHDRSAAASVAGPGAGRSRDGRRHSHHSAASRHPCPRSTRSFRKTAASLRHPSSSARRWSTIPASTSAPAQDPEAFWAGFAGELEWIEPWKEVLRWKPPYAEWFVGGKLNASANCLDRHVRSWRRNKAALIWEGEPGDRRTLTYWDLYRQVGTFANVLKSLGVKKGDRVALYMPLIPELAIAMLACARIGAVHSVVFGGFSAESLRDRINDAQAVLLGDRRWRLPPRTCRAAQAHGGRSARADPFDPERRRRPAPGGLDASRPR